LNFKFKKNIHGNQVFFTIESAYGVPARDPSAIQMTIKSKTPPGILQAYIVLDKD